MSPASNPTFIATADLHLGHRLYGYAELEDDLVDNFRRVCSAAISKKVQYVVLAGDVFDNNQPRPDTVAVVREQSDRLKQHGIGLIGIAGDHDCPVNGAAWVELAGIQPANQVPGFAGTHYYDYSSVSREEFLTRLIAVDDRETVNWLVLHGQVPTLFPFVEPKKRLDFSDWDVFGAFPSLRGVILGDIHDASDGELKEGGRSAFIGYCGSLGIIDASELKHSKHFLHWDGETMHKVPFVGRRQYIRVDLRGELHKTLDIERLKELVAGEQHRPVFIAEADDNTPVESLRKFALLQTVGITRHKLVKKNKDKEVEETVNIRSDLNTGERIVHVLKQVCDNRGLGQPQYQLTLALLTAPEDAVTTLEKFKQEHQHAGG